MFQKFIYTTKIHEDGFMKMYNSTYICTSVSIAGLLTIAKRTKKDAYQQMNG